MIIVTRSWRMWLAGTAVSLVIFAVVYFTVIRPDNNTANQAIKTGLSQAKAALTQSQKALTDSTAGAATAGAATSGAAKAGAAATAKASKELSNAQKLASCVSAAGTDVSKITSCRDQFPG
jgi:type II secretory pathway component PulM